MFREVTWLRVDGANEKVKINAEHIVVMKRAPKILAKKPDPAIPSGTKTILCLSNGLVMPIAEDLYRPLAKN